MKILYLTAGAAGMYCGSCLLDNALAAELMRGGHDVMLLPLYTPTLTDEPNVSQKRVFFGGISVYLEQYFPLFRKTPWLLDRLWDSERVIRLFSGRAISPNPELLGALTVSMLRGEEGNQKKELDKLLHWLCSEGVPDVVHVQNSLLVGLVSPIKKALNRPVCVTLQGEDFFLEHLQSPFQHEALELMRRKAATVDAFLAYTRFYADRMAALLDIPSEKIHVIPLGINLSDFESRATAGDSPLRIGYLARVAPEKGLEVLCEAYRILRQSGGLPPTRLDVAGYLAPEHRPYLASVQEKMETWGLANEFRYHGVLDRRAKVEFLQQLDVFSVPVAFDDPKGMPVLEAMASGVPVVQPRRGAFVEIIERTSGGILVEPDAASLAAGLRSVLGDAALTAELGRKAVAGVHRWHSVVGMANQTIALYASLGKPAGTVTAWQPA